MRPPSIVLFERLYLGGLAVGLVNSALLVTSVSEAEFAAEGTSFFGIRAPDSAEWFRGQQFRQCRNDWRPMPRF